MNYVISLKRTPERLKNFLEQNQHIQFKVFEAIDGSQIKPEGNYSSSALGTALSHLSLWQKCIDLDRPINIFEDDAILHTDFVKLSDSLMNRKFDYIAWGWNYDSDLWASPLPFLSAARFTFNQDSLRLNKTRYLETEVECILMKLYNYCGIMGYSISPKGAAILIKECIPLRETINVEIENYGTMTIRPQGIDSAMPAAYQRMTNCYVCFPPICISENDKSKSTIQS
ncbi:glycosyltransferase family 25 protein [Polynucleobacter paneuropaeus]|nr:glycosyltransferase family 25 protein [Polynucleobacter paneuropaeus]QWD06439.1 glycosyltransferase family 25 protein [Polynucleobacter paneuropaeus]